jgi:hypothetical protein
MAKFEMDNGKSLYVSAPLTLRRLDRALVPRRVTAETAPHLPTRYREVVLTS